MTMLPPVLMVAWAALIASPVSHAVAVAAFVLVVCVTIMLDLHRIARRRSE